MSVFVWGFGRLGQLGLGDRESAHIPQRLLIDKNAGHIARVSTGGLCTVLLTRKGDIYACGCGKYGRLGTGSDDDQLVPVKVSVAKDAKVSQVCSGSWHACAVTYLGRLFTWGYNSKHNVLGRADCDDRLFSFTPGLLPTIRNINVRSVSCGHNFTIVCTDDGRLYSWGCGRYGVLGNGSEECVLEPKPIKSLEKTPIKEISSGYAHCGAVSFDGRLFMFGKGVDGALGFGGDLANKIVPTWHAEMPLLAEQVTSVSCSVGEHRGHTLVLTANGHVYAMGSNYRGKLGVDDQESRRYPTKIPPEYFDNRPVVGVSAGGVHSGAIVDDGRCFTWGSGKDGRLGHAEYLTNAKSYCELRPKEVSALSVAMRIHGDRKCVQISCSHYHTVALIDFE